VGCFTHLRIPGDFSSENPELSMSGQVMKPKEKETLTGLALLYADLLLDF
jgi:hypothetical protein